MAFSGTYWKATKQVASTDNLTDFSFIVDELPTSFFTACTSNDGTKLRCAKDDGITELAFDPIEFDTTTETIVLRVKWSGTVTPTGTYTLRIYPALTENVSYGVNDTYGQYNTYGSDLEGYYPKGGGTDRTSNQRTLTANGGAVEGDSTGFIGKSTSFNGVDQFFEADVTGITSAPYTLISWINRDALGYKTILQLSNSLSASEWYALTGSTSGSELWHWVRDPSSSSGGRYSPVLAGTLDTWEQLSAIEYSSASRVVRLNNANEATNTTDLTPSGINRTSIGRAGDSSPGSYYSGLMQSVALYSTAKSDAFLAQEYAQTSDNATFWGTWIEVSAAQDYELSLDTGIFTFTGNDIDLLYNRSLNLDPGNFNLVGNDISLIANRIVDLNSGTFNLTGLDLSLTYGKGYILSLDPGNFSLTGNDLALISDKVISLNTGAYNLIGQSIDLRYSEEFANSIVVISDNINFNISEDLDGNIILLDGSLNIIDDADLTLLSGSFNFNLEEIS